MRVIPDQDSRDLAAMCRSVLAAELEAAEQWKTLAEAGVLGLAIDGSLGDVGVFCIEAGRALCPRVVQSTVYAALAIDWLSVGSAWLPRLTSGEARAATALFSPRDAADMPRLQAHRDGDRQRVSGVADFVTDADVADVIVATHRRRPGRCRHHDVRHQHRARGHDGWLSGIHGSVSTRLGSTKRPPSMHNSCAGWPTPLWRWTVSIWSASAKR